jgi:type I restriction enzyme, S subunit
VNDWPIRTIGECAADEPYSTQIGPFGKALTPDAYVPSGNPLLRGVNVSGGGRFHDDDYVFISDADADRLSKFESFPGDVLLVHKGSLGHIGLMPKERRFSRYIMGNSMLRVKCDPAKLLPEYLRYWLQSPEGQNYLLSRVSQVGVPQIQRPLNTLREAALPVPPVPVQAQIVGVLGSLDDKIEQNRRTGRKLEGLARAVFKAWFVDFEPVKAKAAGATGFPGMPAATFATLPKRLVNSEFGPVPEWWDNCWHRVSVLEQAGTLLIGDGYRAKRSELAEIGVPFIRAGNVNGSIVTDGAELLGQPAVGKAGIKRSQVWDTVFTSKGTVGRIGLVTPATGDVIYAPQVCFWRALDRDRLSAFLLHLWMKSESFTCQWMSVKGQTDLADFVSLSDQRAMTMLVPPPEVQRGFDNVVRPMVELMAASAAESAKLATLRDYLLPRLLSGRVRVGGGDAGGAAAARDGDGDHQEGHGIGRLDHDQRDRPVQQASAAEEVA